MQLRHRFTFALIMAACALGGLLSICAARHMNERGRAQVFRPLWSRKRDSFTETGWRYRTWSVRCAYLTIAMIVADHMIA